MISKAEGGQLNVNAPDPRKQRTSLVPSSPSPRKASRKTSLLILNKITMPTMNEDVDDKSANLEGPDDELV
jgi:hypothetical protein